MLNKKLAFDTNILVYLLDEKSEFYLKTVKTVSEFEAEGFELVIAQQSIVELVQVLTDYYNLSLVKASTKAKQIVNSKIKIVSPLPQTTKTYLELCKSNKKAKSHFDLFLAATLIDNQVTKILTNDKSGFKNIRQLKAMYLE
ncbi:PIN domain-containing protein [Patescibacteria group bacterium]|nr:PIN domain-containing protein [Patescibacteria group bacterium]